MSRKHYESLGYKYTKKDATFAVKSTELSPGSNYRVRYICDYCSKEGTKRYDTIISQRRVVAKDCCIDCEQLKRKEAMIKERGSLKDNFPEIAKEWDYARNEFRPENYTSSSGDKVAWVCEEGHKWRASIYSRTSGIGCSLCTETEGEKEIAKILTERLIPYIREVGFSDLVGVGRGILRYDFGIKRENGTIELLIEFDGPFHFGEVYKGHDFERAKEHDRRKNEFAIRNKIPLYRIPYTTEEDLCEVISDIINGEGGRFRVTESVHDYERKEEPDSLGKHYHFKTLTR